jgi:hypothetical protein
MAEADIAIYIATAVALAICTIIQFGERSIRYRRLKEQKYAGTMGMKYQPPGDTDQGSKKSTPI